MTGELTRSSLRRQMRAVEDELARLQESGEGGYDVDGEDAGERLRDLVIDLDRVEVIRVTFALGGPGIRAELKRDPDGEIFDAWLFGAWGAEKVEYRLARGVATWRALQSLSDLVPSSN